jgi:hypothetical protein
MNPSNHCDFSAADFTATAFETSDGRLIRVTGSGRCPTAGWELRLVAANPGIVPHPESLWLELRETPPRGAARVLTDTIAEVIIEDTRAEHVVIRFGWREGFSIPIVTQSGPRAGRGSMRDRTKTTGERADAANGRLAASRV